MKAGLSRQVLVAAAAVAIAACDTAAQPAGQRSFEQNCASCHGGGRLPGDRATGLSDPQRRIGLDQFLARHHAPDPAVRNEIIDYLEAQER